MEAKHKFTDEQATAILNALYEFQTVHHMPEYTAHIRKALLESFLDGDKDSDNGQEYLTFYRDVLEERISMTDQVLKFFAELERTTADRKQLKIEA